MRADGYPPAVEFLATAAESQHRLDTSLFPQGTFIQDMEAMKLFEHADTRLQKFVE
jgi:hypothetical protein